MKNFIEHRVYTMKKEYENNHLRVVSDFNREREAIEIYKGREILELIQNADDEISLDLNREIRISYIGNILKVSNNGTPFSEDGINSLMYSNVSTKSNKKDLIGNKGTGFRSILGWAREIKISSGNLHIRFSDKYAQNVLSEVSSKNGTFNQYKAATLVFPEWIDDIGKKQYTTEISIHVKEDNEIIEDIHKQLEDIDGELLLFLNRAEKLTIVTESKTVSFEKNFTDNNTVLLRKHVDNFTVEHQMWYLNRKDGEFEGKNYSIVVAYNPDLFKKKRNVIYSYFPTDVEFPFQVLLHATFNLNSDRNHLLKNNNENKFIIQQATKLLVETALKLTTKGISYEPLKILTPQNTLPKGLVDYEFNELLYTEIKQNKLFPTVNGEYVSFNDQPKFYETNLAQYLNGAGFDDLLMYTKDQRILSLIRVLNNGSYPTYEHDDLVSKMNRWARSNTPSIETMVKHANCAVGLLEQKEYMWDKKVKKMPNLLYDTENKLVSQDSSLFLNDRKSNISTPPKFTKIRFMHPEMKKIFEEILSVSGRNLTIKLARFGVIEYSAARIIDKMNSAIKKKIDGGKQLNAYNYFTEELKWIWENRQNLMGLGEKVRMYFLTRNGNIQLSDSLYFGEEYGNTVCENLFTGPLKDKFVSDIRDYIYPKSTPLAEITNFLQSLGIEKYPRKRIDSVSPNEGYKHRLLEDIHFPYAISGEVFDDLESMCSRIHSMNAQIMKIDELEDILSKCETKHIIEWIIEDPTLSQILFKRKEINNGKIQIMWDKKRDYRVIPLNKVYAYIYWQFETIPWIQVGTDRINISESFLTPIGKSLEPLLYEINIDEYIKGVEGIKTRLRTEFELTFQKLGVVKDYGDLSIDKIYSILNLLPEFTVPENITKNIYSSLIKSDYLITDIKKCKSYETFMKTGKVLCNTGFKNINESFYLDSRSICDKVAGLYNLVEIPRRQNSSNIKKLLGVNKLVLRGKVIGVPEIHPGNTLFQRDFANYKPMAFCYRIGKATKSESRRFAELTIILCTTLKAEYGGKEIELDEYDYVLKDENTFYLKIPRTLTTLDTMKHNVSFAAAISNVMCSHIGVHEPFPSFRELYGANDISRKELLLQIYENESLLEEAKSELNYSEDVKEEFIRIMTKCKGKSTREIDVSFNKLDFSDINSVENGEIIIKCFKKLGIDVHNYNFEQPTVPIDLNDYYLNKIINLKPKYENMYKTHQYRIRNMGLDEKKMLVTEFMNYENIKHNTINSVYFDYKAEFKKEIGLEFEIEKVDLVDVYNKNKSVWESSLKDLSLVNEFLTIPSNMSLIYYGELEELNKEYESLLYARLIEHEESKEVFSNNIDPVVIYPITKPLNQKQKKNSSRVKTKTGFAPPRNLEKIGFLGEKYVFEMLSNKYSNTKWASENGKSAQINPEGVAGLGYDIEYIDENGVRKFVEVKTSKGKEIVFYMSENEFDFAIKHDAVYSVYFVCEVETKKPKILVLNDLFNGNAFNLENYAIDTSREYKVMATYH